MGEESLSILARDGPLISLLVFLGVDYILGVNLDVIFLFNNVKLSSINNTSQLAS